jgi:protein translocase SecG subunit
MATVILIIHIMLALGLIAVVLLQRSEGGALGMGGGGGGFMTGRGAGNFLTRGTCYGVLRNQPGSLDHGRAAGLSPLAAGYAHPGCSGEAGSATAAADTACAGRWHRSAADQPDAGRRRRVQDSAVQVV